MKWIKVSDKKPPTNERVLLWISEFGKKKMIVGLWEGYHVKYTTVTGHKGVFTEKKTDEYHEGWGHDTDCMEGDIFMNEETEVISWRTLPDEPEDECKAEEALTANGESTLTVVSFWGDEKDKL